MTPNEILEAADGMRKMAGPAFDAVVRAVYVNSIIIGLYSAGAMIVAAVAGFIWASRIEADVGDNNDRKFFLRLISCAILVLAAIPLVIGNRASAQCSFPVVPFARFAL